MEALAQAFGIVLRGFSATRYLISLIIGVVVLIYAGLWMIGLVPTDTALANNLRISVGLLLALLYLLTAMTAVSLWYLLVERPAELRNTVPEVARPVYRQTDVSGLRGFNVVLILLILSGLVLSRGIEQIDRPVTVFLGVVALVPLLIDLIPAQRPRRLLVPKHGTTLNVLSQQLVSSEPGDLERLVEYNSATLRGYERRLSQNQPEHEHRPEIGATPLPPGLFVEVPPGID